MRKHHISFMHAWEGISAGFRTQPNFRIHLILSGLVVIAGFIFHISHIEWAIIIFTISTGLAVELVNTSIEYTVDLLTQQYHFLAKMAKDTAAGAMLVYALFSIVIAVIIFLPKIWLFF